MKTGVLVASGGIDSTVLLYELAKKKKVKAVIFFDYGQRSATEQFFRLKTHTTKLKVPLEFQELHLPQYMQGVGAIISGKPKKAGKKKHESLDLSGKELEKWKTDVFDIIPGRNTLFLIYSLAYARSLKLNTVYVGFQHDRPEWEMFLKQRDFTSDGMDTTPGYLDAFNYFILQGAMDSNLRIEAPWFDRQWDKAAIVAHGRKLGADLEDTWSCEFYPECGECGQCRVRKEVLTSQEETVV